MKLVAEGSCFLWLSLPVLPLYQNKPTSTEGNNVSTHERNLKIATLCHRVLVRNMDSLSNIRTKLWLLGMLRIPRISDD